MHNKNMLHQPLRGLDGFPLVPRYKIAANVSVMLFEEFSHVKNFGINNFVFSTFT